MLNLTPINKNGTNVLSLFVCVFFGCASFEFSLTGDRTREECLVWWWWWQWDVNEDKQKKLGGFMQNDAVQLNSTKE